MRLTFASFVTLSALFVAHVPAVHAEPPDSPPSTPSSLIARAYSATAGGIRWDRSTDDRGAVVGYELSRDGVVLGTFDALSHVAHDLERGRTYTFSVVAIDNAGQRSAPNSVRLTATSGGEPAPAVLDPPVNLRADVYSRRSLELFWDRPAPGVETRYEVRRDGELIGVKDGTSFYQINLEPGRLYRYEIVRVPSDGSGRSAVTGLSVSTDGDAPPAAGPAAPFALFADVYSSRDAEIFWSRPDMPLLRYEVSRDGVVLGTTDGVSYYDDTLTAGQRYTYDVVAIDREGRRSDTSSVSFETSGGSPDGSDPGAGDEGEGGDEGDQVPAGTLKRIFRYRDTVFGEDIDTFPEPSRIRPVEYGTDLSEDEDGELRWEYRVLDDQLVNDVFEAPLSHQRMWAAFARLVPGEWRVPLRRVTFYLRRAGSRFDARVEHIRTGGETLLELSLEEQFTDRFVARGVDDYVFSLFVHETGHVIDPVDADSVPALPRWCFWPSCDEPRQSWYQRFGGEFWSDEVTEEWDAYIDEVTGPDTTLTRSELIHEGFAEQFVSRYATTNLSEDFAESFMEFVRRDELPESDAYDGAAKVRWFWRQPALVSLRDQLRAAR